MMMLKISGAVKRFNGHLAVDGVNLGIAAAETICMLGPSGSGKTTLLRMVAGLERVDAGMIEIAGVVADDGKGGFVPPQRRRLGMVFQDYALWPHLCALDNVALPLRTEEPLGAAKRAQSMLARVGLGGLETRRPHELSGGQQQRVALARALAVAPDLLLCDEPLSNLDAALRDDLRELIADVVKETGTSVLYITHDQREAFALADRVAVMQQGRILQVGTPQQLLDGPCCEDVAQMTHAIGPWPATLSTLQALGTPWGDIPPPAPCRPGRFQLYLRPAALARNPPLHSSVRVQARILSRLELPDGAEFRCEISGVKVNLRFDGLIGSGDTIDLHLDPTQILLYPTHTNTPQPETFG